MSLGAYERLDIYGFGVDYTSDCQVELNPKSVREGGDLALKSSDGDRVFISWGPMKKIEKSFKDTTAHAEYNVKRIASGGQAKTEPARHEFVRVNGHPATITHLRLDFVRRGLFKTTRAPQEIWSLHVHCPNSARYFVVYGRGTSEQSARQEAVLAEMVRSFRCH